ncbi:hypothetical protein Vqi01_43870 [Micromonospora qiuiae]|uniref:ATP-grasp domain-containing protein n=1 Tax=Micromonospora qiuiae TaxID=502268 RepID=A0ABQ4JG59_9ACTN|nr:peptide ligase PGM1-related protein [Micromonospora qiuiae]GIJ29225.1 hypothetical protein Vqi01_43870 [Micromonospora qiuiae]
MPNKILLMNYGLNCTIGVYRQMWMVEEGDIVVSAIPVDEEFLAYVCAVSGFDRDRITVLNIGRDVTEEVLASPELAGQLRPLLGGSTAWQLLPAAFTEGVAVLAERLGLPLDIGLRFTAQRGPDLLNRKSHFRQLAAGARVSIPDGCVVTTLPELTAAVERYLPKTGTVIIKRDDDLGGHGNRAVTTKEAGPLSGVRQTVSVNGNIPEVAARLWEELADPGSHVLVVESYHTAERIFFYEYLIDADGSFRILDTGIRRDVPGDPGAAALVWLGLELPADLGASAAAQALTQSAQLVGLAARLGYRGHLNVDGITTAEGEVLFNEMNARWGGCTSLHHIGVNVFGENYADHHVISGMRVITPMVLADAVDLLRRHGLDFSRETGEGVIVLGFDTELGKATECVLVGPSRAGVRKLEQRVREVAGTVSDPALVE